MSPVYEPPGILARLQSAKETTLAEASAHGAPRCKGVGVSPLRIPPFRYRQSVLAAFVAPPVMQKRAHKAARGKERSSEYQSSKNILIAKSGEEGILQ